MTFDGLCALEPRLRDLEHEICAVAAAERHRPCRCANATWYGYSRFAGGGFKGKLERLIGWHREPPGYVPPDLAPLTHEGAGGLVFVRLSDPALGANRDRLVRARREAVDRLDPPARENEPTLRGHEAYDVACDHLYALLPDCRRCGCL